MKKNITYKKALKNAALFAIFSLSALFAGCSNAVTDSSADSKKTSTSGAGVLASDAICTLSGSISLKGGVPLVNQEDLSRSATSNFTKYTNGLEVKAADFVISAVCGRTEDHAGGTDSGQGSSEAVTGTVTYENGKFVYTLLLNKIGVWHVTAKVSDLLTGGMEVMCYPSQFEDAPKDLESEIILEPVIDGTATGNISLTISKASDFDAKSVTWTWVERESTDSNPNYTTKDFNNNSVVFDFPEFSTGSHEVQLSFLNDKGKEVFNCKESVTVYKGFVTNCWYGDSSYFKKSKTGNTEICEFYISDNTVKNYASVEKFSIGTNESNKYEIIDTPILLWNTKKENMVAFDGSNNTATYGKRYTQSVQFFSDFSEIKKDETITVPLPSASNFNPIINLCFGGENGKYIYYMPSEYGDNSHCLLRYKKSYCGYVLDNSFSVNLFDKLTALDAEAFQDMYGFLAYTYYNGAIYLAINVGSDSSFDFGRYDIATDTMIVARDADGSIAVMPKEEMASFGCIAVTEGVITKTENGGAVEKPCVYLAYSGTNMYSDHDKTKVSKAIFIIENNSSTGAINNLVFDSSSEFSIEGRTDGNYKLVDDYYHIEEDNIEITDLMIRNETVTGSDGNTTETRPFVYALIRARTKSANPLPSAFEKEVTKAEDGTDKINYKPYYFFTSNGGVLKFDLTLTETNFKPSKWTGYGEFSDKYILGWYTRSDPLYTKGETEGTYNSITSKSITVCPPDATENVYFYGPEKFIAIKPDELVIADDGAYVYVNDKYKFTIKEKNRVIKVNLKNASIEATDVDVTFSKSLVMSSGFGLSED